MRCQSGTSKWKSGDSVATIIEKEVALMEKKHSEKEKTSLDSPSPKLNKSMIAYHETGGIIELVYIVLQSVVKPGITGFFKIDLHIKCYIYLS